MRAKLQGLIELWDIPGGSILGLWSVTMLVLGVLAWHTGRDIPPNVKEMFNWILTAFAASKTLKTIFGKATSDEPPKGTS
jgi:hypothetical protein